MAAYKSTSANPLCVTTMVFTPVLRGRNVVATPPTGAGTKFQASLFHRANVALILPARITLSASAQGSSIILYSGRHQPGHRGTSARLVAKYLL